MRKLAKASASVKVVVRNSATHSADVGTLKPEPKVVQGFSAPPTPVFDQRVSSLVESQSFIANPVNIKSDPSVPAVTPIEFETDSFCLFYEIY